MAAVHTPTLPSVAMLRPSAAAGKRAFDLLLGAAALIVLAPLLLALMLAIVLESPGNPIFVQQRLGQGGRRFPMYKLRTMVKDAERRRAEIEHLNESEWPLFKVRHDPRVTRLGRFLRLTSLDELPQLINVLKGEMSIVGPRPRLPAEFAEVMERPDVIRRFSVKPGLAGVWQVNGRDDDDFEQALALDLSYIDNWSFWFDLKLIAKTFLVVVAGSGAY